MLGYNIVKLSAGLTCRYQNISPIHSDMVGELSVYVQKLYKSISGTDTALKAERVICNDMICQLPDHLFAGGFFTFSERINYVEKL